MESPETLPTTAQEIKLALLKEDGWEIVIWEREKVCLVLRGTRRFRTRYAELFEDGTFAVLP